MNLPWTLARDLRQSAWRQRGRLLTLRAAAVRAAALPDQDFKAWCHALETP